MSDKKMIENAHLMRQTMLEMGKHAGQKGAHFGGGLSLTEFFSVLYTQFYTPDDFVILSKGHGTLSYYAGLYIAGIITQDELLTFEEDGGDFPGQPIKNKRYSIDFSSGSLGMGFSYGAGIAYGNKKKKKSGKIYVILGDGECNEGSIWEAAMFAGHHHLNNLIIFVDVNGIQSDGPTSEILSFDMKKMWEACGFYTICLEDGHDTKKIQDSLLRAKQEKTKPTVLLAKTVKGKGISFMENEVSWHHAILNNSLYQKASEELR